METYHGTTEALGVDVGHFLSDGRGRVVADPLVATARKEVSGAGHEGRKAGAGSELSDDERYKVIKVFK